MLVPDHIHGSTNRMLDILRQHPEGLTSKELFTLLYKQDPEYRFVTRHWGWDTTRIRALVSQYNNARPKGAPPGKIIRVKRDSRTSVYILKLDDHPVILAGIPRDALRVIVERPHSTITYKIVDGNLVPLQEAA